MLAIVLGGKLFFAGIAVTVKRLHDTNRSGWCILIGLALGIAGVVHTLLSIPGFIYFVVVCGCLKGTNGDNKYGSPVDKMR